MRIVGAQDLQGLGNGLHLHLAGLLALLPLLVGHGALLLEHHEELLIGRKRGPSVFDVLLGLGVLEVSVGKLLRLGVDLSGACSDLSLLCRLQLIIGLLVGELLLLRVGQVGLEGVLHVPQDAKDLSRLRGVGLLESGRGIEVVLRCLNEGVDLAALGAREDALEQLAVGRHLVGQSGSHTQDAASWSLEQGASVMLGKHRDGCLQGLDRLQQVLLLRVELSQLLLAESGGLVQGLLVLGALLLEVLDLCVQLCRCRSELLDLGGQLRDLRLCICNGLSLFLVVCLAPARHLLVDLLILLLLFLQLLHHVLEKCDHFGDRSVWLTDSSGRY
mmetsp:Transcript_37303/g.87357  ORF Transcript_37303/g.87357 Transcript_37303/m.87357 type:complete len:331 (+) Transcript_37303:1058-2050(+)